MKNLVKNLYQKKKESKNVRNIGRFIYPSDSKVGEELGTKMFRYIKKDIENKL